MKPLHGALPAILTVVAIGLEAQTLPPEEAALVVLESACRGFNEKKYDYAVERFREFLRLYGGHVQAVRAHYGLGLALVYASRPDLEAALQSLGQVAANQAFSERPLALYYMGLARRFLGDQAMERAQAKPSEAAQHRAVALQQYAEAAKHFGEASTAFLARVGTPLPATESSDLEWATRSRCDQCDMLLRLGQFKEARALAESLLGDPIAARSQFREYALYPVSYTHLRAHET
ncbi:MAG: hypothetical protein N2255_04765, partial [Kiritimatiellae bacterium]|nr:hypothetical protein [Kiritimatiellia bacterium]